MICKEIDMPTLKASRRSMIGMGILPLTRRHLTLIYLLGEYIDKEIERLSNLPVDEAAHLWFANIPTTAMFFSKSNTGEIRSSFNDFVAEHGAYDNPLVEANQLTRIVRDLQAFGLLYNPQLPAEAEMMGDPAALIPKQVTLGIYRWLRAKNVDEWPDVLPFDIANQVALYDHVSSPFRRGG